MERTSLPSRRPSIGLVLGIVLTIAGFWLRSSTVAKATNFAQNLDLGSAFESASTLNRNLEVGLFLIVLGGLIFLMSFWRWLDRG